MPARPLPRSALRRATTAATTLLLLGALAGCGGSDAAEEDGGEDVDAGAQECRDQWRELSDEAAERTDPETPATPSMLRTRWVTVAATADYYAASATADDCGDVLDAERATTERLDAFSDSLAEWDMEKRSAGYGASDAVTAYARPSGREGRAAPSERQVRAALRDLERLAPQATGEQSAAWQQAAVTDLADRAARRKAVADLRVVSGESSAYRDAAAAARVLARATKAADGD